MLLREEVLLLREATTTTRRDPGDRVAATTATRAATTRDKGSIVRAVVAEEAWDHDPAVRDQEPTTTWAEVEATTTWEEGTWEGLPPKETWEEEGSTRDLPSSSTTSPLQSSLASQEGSRGTFSSTQPRTAAPFLSSSTRQVGTTRREEVATATITWEEEEAMELVTRELEVITKHHQRREDMEETRVVLLL